jgi:arylsulfatase A-like enzyme
MGLHGNPLNLTPNLDRLAGRNTFLANTFSCQPVCGPARACMQTGKYASRTGCYRNGVGLAWIEAVEGARPRIEEAPDRLNVPYRFTAKEADAIYNENNYAAPGV